MNEVLVRENKATYDEFQEKVEVELQKLFPRGTMIQIHTIQHNNQSSIDGLTILEPGKTVSPVIDLMTYYRIWMTGIPLSEIMQRIQLEYQMKQQEDIDCSFYYDFQLVKSRIIFRLVHFKRNQKLLEDIPYVRFLDFAVIFYYVIDVNKEHCMTIRINNYHMKEWNKSPEELYYYAQKNTPVFFPYDLKNMLDFVKENTIFEIEPDSVRYPMYILSNKYSFRGAACILYEGLLSLLAGELYADLYIIPSSVDQVLLLPAKDWMEEICFNKMIENVNDSLLEPSEFLSDHVYYFSREENKILALE